MLELSMIIGSENNIWEKFSLNFEKRLSKHDKNKVSEDCMRFDLLSSMLDDGINSENCVLEYPHPHDEFKGREIDLVLVDDDMNEKVFVEMKYYRRIPSDKQDTTSYMAKLVVDLLKLSFICSENADKYFVMATDMVMQKYISRESNGFSNLLSTNLDCQFDVSAGNKMKKSEHFKKNILKDISNSLSPETASARIKRVFQKKITEEDFIYVFKVF